MVRPRQPIRRFEVFAEYHRLDRMQQGQPADEAKRYGLWLEKLVAARKFAKWKTVQDLDRLRPRHSSTHPARKENSPDPWLVQAPLDPVSKI
jgi:hypothetical protein